jgi:hypothetical protein
MGQYREIHNSNRHKIVKNFTCIQDDLIRYNGINHNNAMSHALSVNEFSNRRTC